MSTGKENSINIMEYLDDIIHNLEKQDAGIFSKK